MSNQFRIEIGNEIREISVSPSDYGEGWEVTIQTADAEEYCPKWRLRNILPFRTKNTAYKVWRELLSRFSENVVSVDETPELSPWTQAAE